MSQTIEPKHDKRMTVVRDLQPVKTRMDEYIMEPSSESFSAFSAFMEKYQETETINPTETESITKKAKVDLVNDCRSILLHNNDVTSNHTSFPNHQLDTNNRNTFLDVNIHQPPFISPHPPPNYCGHLVPMFTLGEGYEQINHQSRISRIAIEKEPVGFRHPTSSYNNRNASHGYSLATSKISPPTSTAKPIGVSLKEMTVEAIIEDLEAIHSTKSKPTGKSTETPLDSSLHLRSTF